MPAALDHARHGQLTSASHAGAGTGPIDLRPAVRPHRPAAGAAGGAAVCRRVAGAAAAAAAGSSSRGGCYSAGRLGRAGGHVRHARAMFMPTGRKAPSMACSAPCCLRPRARADARRGHRGGLRLAGDLRRAGRGTCWRGCAPCRAGARPVHPRRARGGRLRAHAGQPAVLDLYAGIQRGDGRLLRVLLDLAARAAGRRRLLA